MGRVGCVPVPSPCAAFNTPPPPAPRLNGVGARRYVLLNTMTMIPGAPRHVRKAVVTMAGIFLGRIETLGVAPTIIGVDSGGGNASCRPLIDAGMTCLPDNLHAYCAVHNHTVMSWVPAANRDTDRFGTRNVAVDAKYWYALRFLRFGHTVVFADLDVLFFRSPLARSAPGRGLQGLSDSLQFFDADDERRIGNQTRCHPALAYGAPCQSTGLWFAQPTAAVIAFFDHFLSELRRTCEWEQSLFNRALHGRVRGSSWWRAMNYSVLSKQHYANVDVFEERVGFNCSNDLVAIHMGYVSQADKVSRLRGVLSQGLGMHRRRRR